MKALTIFCLLAFVSCGKQVKPKNVPVYINNSDDQAKILELETKINALNQIIVGLNNTIESNQMVINSLSARNEELESQVLILAKANEDLNDMIDELNVKVYNLNKQLEELAIDNKPKKTKHNRRK